MSSGNTSQRLWVTGAGGLIGHYVDRLAPALLRDNQIVGLTRHTLDLTNFSAVEEKFRREQPSAVIHCAALSKTQDCQANPALAHRLNVDVTEHLATLAHEIPFILFSTDLVFDGTKGNYDESARVNPLGVYGETKVAAEALVLKNPRHTVVRTSLNAGISPTGDRAFNELLRQAWEKGETLNLFTDEYRCPIAAELTARAVLELLRAGSTGVFHVAGSEKLSRYEAGLALAKRWPQLNPRIVAGSLKQYPGAARSPDTSLHCAKAQSRLSFALPGFRAWLAAAPESAV